MHERQAFVFRLEHRGIAAGIEIDISQPGPRNRKIAFVASIGWVGVDNSLTDIDASKVRVARFFVPAESASGIAHHCISVCNSLLCVPVGGVPIAATL